MSDANGESRRFRIEWPQSAVDQLKDCYRLADARGMGWRVIDAAKQIRDRLVNSPQDFGEAMYELPNTGQQMRMAGVGPLFVTFAVHAQSKYVFIQKFMLFGA